MKICLQCQTSNAPDAKFCKRCGTPLESAQPAADATLKMTGAELARGPLRQSFPIDAMLAAKTPLVIGRAPDCDVRLPHPTVSRYHAMLERREEGIWLLDLGSVNGVTVAGNRINVACILREGHRVGIGPFLLSFTQGVLHSLDNSRGLRLEARGLEKVIQVGNGAMKKLLDDVNLVVQPGEFVTLLGPSGSGKSTLMDCLNGRRRATGGTVLANGEDFYRHFDNFRQSLGYVPQKDIVHTQLTVERALRYTARLRLPPDTAPDEIKGRVEAVLNEMELAPHRNTLVGNLSGGQIKRVSLGAELLAEPSMLFIDEATSGLDAGTEARMMRLFRRLTDEGRSIVCITHSVDNVGQCHLVLVLAQGKVVYLGPPAEAPHFFKVNRISDIYDCLGQKNGMDWEKEFAASSFCKTYIQDPLAAPLTPARPAPFSRPAPIYPASTPTINRLPNLAESFRRLTAGYLKLREWTNPVREQWHQFIVLTQRYFELILGDRRGLRLLLLQAPIVAAFLLLGFAGKDFRQKLLIPRPLTPEERRTFHLFVALDKSLGEEKNDPALALKDLRFQLKGGKFPVTVNGVQALDLLKKLHGGKLSSEERKALQEAKFTFEAEGETKTVTGEDLLKSWEQIHGSGIAEKLLAYSGPVVPDRESVNPRYTYIMLFIVVMIVLWFGCNNAAKEIVKEEAIFCRERAVNLGIFPYLASKFLVLTLITVFHALVLLAVLFGALETVHYFSPGHSLPDPEHMLSYGGQLGVLTLLAMTGVALGLLLSACVSSADRANALLPYVLIPQMILGGGILTVQGVMYYLAATLSPVYWAYRAIHRGASALPRGFPMAVDYPEGIGLPCQALMLQTAFLLCLTAWFLRRKDV
jgi:ABC-type multidrug transport system ATPase subunit